MSPNLTVVRSDENDTIMIELDRPRELSLVGSEMCKSHRRQLPDRHGEGDLPL